MMHLIPASQLDIKAYVYEHLELGGHGFRTTVMVQCLGL